jgi:hypothetical protein
VHGPLHRSEGPCPQWPQYIAHPPYVKGFKHHDGYGVGMRLLYTWMDKQ